jgi:hypothetical protein
VDPYSASAHLRPVLSCLVPARAAVFWRGGSIVTPYPGGYVLMPPVLSGNLSVVSSDSLSCGQTVLIGPNRENATKYEYGNTNPAGLRGRVGSSRGRLLNR